MSDSTLQKIKEVISEKLACSQDIIKLESRFVKDLGADSLDIVELVMGLEEEFGMEIPDEDAENLETIKDVLDYIQKYI